MHTGACLRPVRSKCTGSYIPSSHLQWMQQWIAASTEMRACSTDQPHGTVYTATPGSCRITLPVCERPRTLDISNLGVAALSHACHLIQEARAVLNQSNPSQCVNAALACVCDTLRFIVCCQIGSAGRLCSCMCARLCRDRRRHVRV